MLNKIPEKLPSQRERSLPWSSYHHFSGAMLNFRGVHLFFGGVGLKFTHENSPACGDRCSSFSWPVDGVVVIAELPFCWPTFDVLV